MHFNLNIEDIKYIKIYYKDLDSNQRSFRAAVRKINNSEILASTKLEDSLTIRTPQEVSLKIICNNGLYNATTNLLAIFNDDPYVFVKLEPPTNIVFQQNREYFRVGVQYDCLIRTKIENEWVETPAQSYDISANGVSVIIDKPIITNDTTNINMRIDDRFVKANVQYVRSEKYKDKYKLSLKYIKINESERDFISQTCIKKQLEQKRNSLY